MVRIQHRLVPLIACLMLAGCSHFDLRNGIPWMPGEDGEESEVEPRAGPRGVLERGERAGRHQRQPCVQPPDDVARGAQDLARLLAALDDEGHRPRSDLRMRHVHLGIGLGLQLLRADVAGDADDLDRIGTADANRPRAGFGA